jgi:hypothetical protein
MLTYMIPLHHLRSVAVAVGTGKGQRAQLIMRLLPSVAVVKGHDTKMEKDDEFYWKQHPLCRSGTKYKKCKKQDLNVSQTFHCIALAQHPPHRFDPPRSKLTKHNHLTQTNHIVAALGQPQLEAHSHQSINLKSIIEEVSQKSLTLHSLIHLCQLHFFHAP